MVVSKALVAKIDRPMGIVSFQVAKDSNDILNSWAMNLEKLLDLVEKSCHQIHKETMVHKAALKVWKGWCHWMHEGLSLSPSPSPYIYIYIYALFLFVERRKPSLSIFLFRSILSYWLVRKEINRYISNWATFNLWYAV